MRLKKPCPILVSATGHIMACCAEESARTAKKEVARLPIAYQSHTDKRKQVR